MNKPSLSLILLHSLTCCPPRYCSPQWECFSNRVNLLFVPHGWNCLWQTNIPNISPSTVSIVTLCRCQSICHCIGIIKLLSSGLSFPATPGKRITCTQPVVYQAGGNGIVLVPGLCLNTQPTLMISLINSSRGRAPAWGEINVCHWAMRLSLLLQTLDRGDKELLTYAAFVSVSHFVFPWDQI